MRVRPDDAVPQHGQRNPVHGCGRTIGDDVCVMIKANVYTGVNKPMPEERHPL